MKLLMMGPQGCGKGTIGKMLSSYYSIPLVSVGEVLRSLPSDHRWKAQVSAYMDSGELVPNDMVGEILKEEFEKEKYHRGFIMDGWGRQMSDLTVFDPHFDKVLLLNISENTSLQRLKNRRTCTKCGAIYNVISKPTRVDGVCDVCGGPVILREDDSEEAIKTRLRIYREVTSQVVDYFRGKGVLAEVNAEGEPREVFAEVLKKL